MIKFKKKKKQFREFLKIYDKGMKINYLARYLGISYRTVYRWIKELEKNN